MIIVGYIGITFAIILIPKTKNSNTIYNLLILFAIIISSIIGHIDDKTSLSILAFFPRSYMLSLFLAIIRIGCATIGIINATKFRSIHYASHTTTDIILDFGLSYIRTIALISLSEIETTWIMSWVYNIGIILNLDPTIKIDSESYYDEILRSFALLFYGIRLSLISYNLFIPYFSGIFLIFVGLYKAYSYTINDTRFKYFCFLYA